MLNLECFNIESSGEGVPSRRIRTRAAATRRRLSQVATRAVGDGRKLDPPGRASKVSELDAGLKLQ